MKPIQWRSVQEYHPTIMKYALDPMAGGRARVISTFLPAIRTLPSADQLKVNASPPTSRWLTHVFERTSHIRTVPSLEQLASSESRAGLKRTFSIPAV